MFSVLVSIFSRGIKWKCDPRILIWWPTQRRIGQATPSHVLWESFHLPHTSAAIKNKSARVYYQVQEWMGRHTLEPQRRGWGLVEGRWDPKATDAPPAPDTLLKMFVCSCKTTVSELGHTTFFFYFLSYDPDIISCTKSICGPTGFSAFFLVIFCVQRFVSSSSVLCHAPINLWAIRCFECHAHVHYRIVGHDVSKHWRAVKKLTLDKTFVD